MQGKKMSTCHFQVSEYTGELFGVEYLYSQSGYTLSPKEEELDKEIDEGFGGINEEATASPPILMTPESDIITFTPPDDPTVMSIRKMSQKWRRRYDHMILVLQT